MFFASPLELARLQIESARAYTHSLLEDAGDDDWFRIPRGGVTHLAWQVGHLAMAQYMLTLYRLRGKEPDDEELISKAFLRYFLKGTQPKADASQYPPMADIRATFDAVHEQVMQTLAEYPPEELDESVGEPYVIAPTRLGSLFFCAHHEMLHAGQIGLLRRCLGKDPV